MNIGAIAVVCIVATALIKVIEPTSREIGFALSVLTAVIILLSVCQDIGVLIDDIKAIADNIGVSQDMISISVKILGITYLCEVTSSTCRDAGESSLGTVLELSGRIAIGVICLPIITALVDRIIQILE